MITDKMVEAALTAWLDTAREQSSRDGGSDITTRLRAALQAAQSAAPPPSADDAPAGWKLVPPFPSIAMCVAAASADKSSRLETDHYNDAYRAMLAAAPDAPRSGDAPVAILHFDSEPGSPPRVEWLGGVTVHEGTKLYPTPVSAPAQDERCTWTRVLSASESGATLPLNLRMQALHNAIYEYGVPDDHPLHQMVHAAIDASAVSESSYVAALDESVRAHIDDLNAQVSTLRNRLSAPADARDGGQPEPAMYQWRIIADPWEPDREWKTATKQGFDTVMAGGKYPGQHRRCEVRALIPADLDRLAAAKDEADARDGCPHCNGSGETTALVGGGPDAYETPVNCPKCAGTGAQGCAQ